MSKYQPQLSKLKDRMSKSSLEKRAQHIIARQTVATMIGRRQAVTEGAINRIFGVLGRGFFGRLKWLLVGR